MIPAFNEFGYLPPGVHPATIEEIAERFGRISELRRVQMESVRWMVDLAVCAGVLRIVLNGSFVTDIMEPNDVDCVLLVDEAYPTSADAGIDLEKGLPFLDISIVRRIPFYELVFEMFAEDRLGNSKGVIEVLL